MAMQSLPTQWQHDTYTRLYRNDLYRDLTTRFEYLTSMSPDEQIAACNLLIDACFDRLALAEAGIAAARFGSAAEFKLRLMLVKSMRQPELTETLQLLEDYVSRFSAEKPAPAAPAMPAPVSNWTPAPKTTLDAFIDMAKGNDFLVLDTETTGLDAGEICEIAILSSKGDRLLNTMVRTVKPVPAEATRIHGIGDVALERAPRWLEVRNQVMDIVRGKNLVVYNATYDRKMMHKSDEAIGIPHFDWRGLCKWYCAMEAYAEYRHEWNDYHGNWRWHKLSVAAQQQGVVVDNAHSALGDCIMTLALIQKMIPAYVPAR